MDCPTGKVAYPTPKVCWDAIAHRNRDTRTRTRTGKTGRAYRCPDCGQWHMTSHLPAPLRRREVA